MSDAGISGTAQKAPAVVVFQGDIDANPVRIVVTQGDAFVEEGDGYDRMGEPIWRDVEDKTSIIAVLTMFAVSKA